MEGEGEEMVGGLMRIKNGQILRGGEFVDGELFVDLDALVVDLHGRCLDIAECAGSMWSTIEPVK